MKHISRMADNYFIVPRKPNILSIGFRTFTVTVRAAKNPQSPHLIIALHYQCIYFLVISYMLISLTEKNIEWKTKR